MESHAPPDFETLDLFKALEDDELEMRGLSDTLYDGDLYHCQQPDETYRKQWELSL